MNTRFEFNVENAPKLEGNLERLYHPKYYQVVGWYGDDKGNGILFVEHKEGISLIEVPLKDGMVCGTIRWLNGDGSKLSLTAEYHEDEHMGWQRRYYHEDGNSENEGAILDECKYEGVYRTGLERVFNKDGALLFETAWQGDTWNSGRSRGFKADGTPVEEVNWGGSGFHGLVRLHKGDGSLHYEGYFIKGDRCTKEEFEAYDKKDKYKEAD